MKQYVIVQKMDCDCRCGLKLGYVPNWLPPPFRSLFWRPFKKEELPKAMKEVRTKYPYYEFETIILPKEVCKR